MPTTTARDVLDFWFQGDPTAWRTDPWFKKNDEFDAAIRSRFTLALQAAQDGVLDRWTDTHEGMLALILVLDQFARNIHRGSYLAFAGDAHARRIARAALEAGADKTLTPVQRVFVYLPFEHSEAIADQRLSVRLFAGLAGPPWAASVLDYAKRHRDVIRRFGRFPHRNAALGRISTPEEEAYLAEPGSGF